MVTEEEVMDYFTTEDYKPEAFGISELPLREYLKQAAAGGDRWTSDAP